MSRYEALNRHLAKQTGSRWTATFDQIEGILGSPLPSSAYKYPAWWANQSGSGHIQSAAWQRAGWRTARLDLERKRVDFERVRELDQDSARSDEDRRSGESLSRLIEERVALVRNLTGLVDRDAIILAGLQALLNREGARVLREIGGTMPDFEAPPRRRFPE